MKVAAITITFNRLELTKRMVDKFYESTKVDYHLFIDNGSTDGSQEWIQQNFDNIFLPENMGIAYAFATAVNALEDFDYILKLDNDVEPVTLNIIEKMLKFFEMNNDRFVVSPVDLLLDKNFKPKATGIAKLNGYNVEYVTHTGGAFQLIPIDACRKLCQDYRHLLQGDYAIGRYFRSIGYIPTYLTDLKMNHFGLNQSTPKNLYKM